MIEADAFVNKCIALFRGINVGGNVRLPMKELVGLLESMGAKNVRTYIQSGNAVFESAEKNCSKLSGNIAAAVKKHHGFEPHVLVMSLDTLEEAIVNNPFPDAVGDPGKLHLGFLASVPKRPDLEKLESPAKDGERFRLIGSVFYLQAPEGVGRSRLAANAEKLLGVPMTDRNWRTANKLDAMATQ